MGRNGRGNGRTYPSNGSPYGLCHTRASLDPKKWGDGRLAILVICSLRGSCPKSVTGRGGGKNMESPNTEGRGTIWKVPLTEKVGKSLSTLNEGGKYNGKSPQLRRWEGLATQYETSPNFEREGGGKIWSLSTLKEEGQYGKSP